MPALLFPNLDTLRLVLASGMVPRHVSGGPARAACDAHGRLWLEPATPPGRDVLAGLARFGVQVLAAADGPLTECVACWAELVPLRPAAAIAGGAPGLVLFELADPLAAGFCRSLARNSKHPIGVRVLSAEGAGRVWVAVESPPFELLLRCQEPTAPAEAFVEQRPGLWTRLGWEHPLPEQLGELDGRVRLLRPPRAVAVHPGPVLVPVAGEFVVRGRTTIAPPSQLGPRIPVRLTLRPARETPREVVWAVRDAEAHALWDFFRGGDERQVRRFEVAAATVAGEAWLVVRPAARKRLPSPLLAASGYYADPRVPGLLLPAGKSLQPVVRAKVLARLLDAAPDRLTWVDAGSDGGLVVRSVPLVAFRPAAQLLEYATPAPVRLVAGPSDLDPFPLTPFALHPADEDRAGGDAEDDPDATSHADPGAADAADEHGWFTRSLGRLAGGLRRLTSGAARPDVPSPVEPVSSGKRVKDGGGTASGRVEDKLTSADVLLHGRDRAARRGELEARLLDTFPRLGPKGRADGWAELASVYAATGHPADAAVCWVNAVWEADPPPDGWLEQWHLAECRATKQPSPAVPLDRWLAEPGRAGAARVVAAYTAWAGRRSPPPADLVAALPRVLAFLDQNFDDLPARAAWLARLATARLCGGDALGLARWGDRVLARLRDKGPGLDLDEPSFLRFHGTASPDRFQTARGWLARARKPILDWVARLGPAGKLQWAGLDAETECTAAYAQLLLAWGLGHLGERTRSRDWTARARKVLARAAGPGVDPAVHGLLSDLFQHRTRDAQDGRPGKPGLPADLLPAFERLSPFSRHAVDRLRDHCRVLEPAARVQAYRGLDLRVFRGADRLGERLQLFADRPGPAALADEARELLAVCDADPCSATVPRVVLTLLDAAPHLDRPAVGTLLGHVVAAAEWLETWLLAGRWADAERADRLPRYLARLLGGAFAAAGAADLPAAARPLVEYLLRRTPTDPVLRAAAGHTAGPLFRALRKLGFRSEAEALVETLDPARGEWPSAAPFPPARLGVAVGWFAAGDDDAGNRILDDARGRLFVARVGDDRDRTELAIGYAEALGFAPPRIALGRLEEIFQLLDRVTVTGSTNRYYTLKPLQLIDSVVRAVVTEDFVLGPAVRGWLADDEFLIRRRIHRDLAGVLTADPLGTDVEG